MAAAGDRPGLHSLQDGTPLFLRMAAPHETALIQVGPEFQEGLRQMRFQLQLQILSVKGTEARCVDHLAAAVQAVEFHVAGGVLSAA